MAGDNDGWGFTKDENIRQSALRWVEGQAGRQAGRQQCIVRWVRGAECGERVEPIGRETRIKDMRGGGVGEGRGLGAAGVPL